MNKAEETIWIAEQASGGLFYIGWVTAIIIGLIGVTGWLQRKEIRKKGKELIWLMLPLLGIAFILLSGSILKKEEAFWWMPYAGLFMTFIFSIVAVWKLNRTRFFAAATSSFGMWYGFWCALVSIMSITDDWI